MSNHTNLLPVYQCPEPVFTHGQGLWAYDAEGQSYLDFASGVAVNIFGHCHPELVQSLQQQAECFWHISNWWQNQGALGLAEQLCARSFADKVFLCNSGAEANEAALKLARKYAYDQGHKNKHKIVSCRGGFHGRTLFTISASGKYHEPFAPLPGEFPQVDFNDCQALAQTIDAQTCACIIEPVQGEGGVRVASAEFLQAARAACDAHGALLIFDEIQTGMGRTGALFAHQASGVSPDIMTLAKALGAGFPIGAMLTTSDLASTLSPGWHGTTFGGNPLAAAVASKVVSMVDDDLLAQVRANASLLRDSLQQLNQAHAFYSELRGAGLLIGMQLLPAIQGPRLQQACLEQGLLVLLAGGGAVLRLAPALIVSKTEIDVAINKLAQALQSIHE